MHFKIISLNALRTLLFFFLSFFGECPGLVFSLKKPIKPNMVNVENNSVVLLSGTMPKPYRRDLIVLFVVKLVLLTGLFLACFSPKNRPAIGPLETTHLILSSKETPHA